MLFPISSKLLSSLKLSVFAFRELVLFILVNKSNSAVEVENSVTTIFDREGVAGLGDSGERGKEAIVLFDN